MKKTIALAIAVLLGILIPFRSASLEVRADGPVTYYVKYVESLGEFRQQIGGWDDQNGNGREIYYMGLDIKDGDAIVVDTAGNRFEFSTSAKLGNLTVISGSAVITAGGITDCYVLKNSIGVVNGNVTNAYVYDNGVANFNNNVSELLILAESSFNANVAVGGTVGHVRGDDGTKTCFDYYSVQENKFRLVDGAWQTPFEYCSPNPPAGNSAPATPSSNAGSSAGSAASAPASGGGEYDDVPKTGDVFLGYWLLGAAAACFLGGLKLKRN